MASVFETEITSVRIRPGGLKYCKLCQADKDIEEFAFKNKAKGIRLSYCRSCQSDRSKAHYRANKEAYLERNRRQQHTVAAWIREYKEKHPCMDCGGNFPHRAMDFHHRDGDEKAFVISHRGYRGGSLRTVQNEIMKCDLLCAVCHRLRHPCGCCDHSVRL